MFQTHAAFMKFTTRSACVLLHAYPTGDATNVAAVEATAPIVEEHVENPARHQIGAWT